VGLIPQSGNTGRVGGQVPLADPGRGNRPEVIVSLQRLNKVRGLEAAAGVMTLEAGITVKKAQEIAEEAGALFALWVRNGRPAGIRNASAEAEQYEPES